MTTRTEYRDGFINQIGPPGSAFAIQGSLNISSNRTNVHVGFNKSVTFVNTSDNTNNTCRMYWTCLGNQIEYDLISQTFDKDIIVSKQLNYILETNSDTGLFTGEIMVDQDSNTTQDPRDFAFGNSACRILPNALNDIRLYDPNSGYPSSNGRPDWWAAAEIAPYFDGLEITFLKTDTASADFYQASPSETNFYHNNPTRNLNPAGNVSFSQFKFRPKQHLKAKIIRTGANTYGWHIMEGKTPAT